MRSKIEVIQPGKLTSQRSHGSFGSDDFSFANGQGLKEASTYDYLKGSVCLNYATIVFWINKQFQCRFTSVQSTNASQGVSYNGGWYSNFLNVSPSQQAVPVLTSWINNHDNHAAQGHRQSPQVHERQLVQLVVCFLILLMLRLPRHPLLR